MSLRRKILLPIFITLLVITGVFSYLLYQLYIEQRLIEENINKIENLNSLNRQLGDLQSDSDFNVLAYQTNQSPIYLESISHTQLKISEVLDKMSPLIDSAAGRELVKNYIESKRNVEKLRNDFILSAQNNDTREQQIAYTKWRVQTDHVRATLADFDVYNLRTGERLLGVLKDAQYRLALIILFILGSVIALIIFLFFYLDKIITQPILVVMNNTKEISKANFLTTKINIHSSDEIGSLVKNINRMNIKLKKLYTNLEEKVRQRAKELQDVNERYRIITNNFPNGGVALIDKTFRFLTTGGQEFTNLGLASNAMEGKKVNEIFPKNLVIQAEPFFRKTLTGEETIFEAVFNKKIYLVRNIPIKDRLGKITSFISMAQNITVEKQSEQKKDEFVSIASHELKTPLTSLTAYTQILQEKLKRHGEKEMINLLSKMGTQLNKLTNLVGDFLDVTKIRTGKLQFNMQHYDFDKLISETVEIMQFTTSKHVLIAEGKAEKNMYGDKDRTEQVITNLLSNAIKYSPASDKIIIKVSVEKDMVITCVRDFGVGISKSEQKKVFDRFFQVNSPSPLPSPGLGLGLYISAEIIRRLGGKIWVESIKGKGSSFYFSLPIKRKGLPIEAE